MLVSKDKYVQIDAPINEVQRHGKIEDTVVACVTGVFILSELVVVDQLVSFIFLMSEERL